MQHRKSLASAMLEHVAVQQRSDETISSYAKRNGISHQKMHYWINKSKASNKTQKEETDTSAQFYDLGSFGIEHKHEWDEAGRVTGNLAKGEGLPGQPQPDERLPQITLSFPNGMCLKIY